jgi:pimeloyl-ACP methyl ester carboxylesterase
LENYKYQTVGKYKIAYRRAGSGVPMLLVHGITTYSFIWRNLIPRRKDNFDVIAVDLLGCGESDKPPGVDYSISAQADLLIEFMDSLGIQTFHLVAHDIGGGVAQIISVRAKERVLDLALINSIAYDFWPVQPIISMRIPILRQFAMAALDFGVFKILVKRGVFNKKLVTDELMALYFKPLKNKSGRMGFLQLAKSLDNRHLMSIADDLKKLSIPVLIIRGEEDAYLTPEISERLHNEIPGAEYVKLSEAGHYIMEDKPEEIIKLINDFCSEGGRTE